MHLTPTPAAQSNIYMTHATVTGSSLRKTTHSGCILRRETPINPLISEDINTVKLDTIQFRMINTSTGEKHHSPAAGLSLL